MARSLRKCNAAGHFLASLVADTTPAVAVAARRGITGAASQGAASSGYSRVGLMGKVEEASAAMEGNSGPSSAWAPDPVTGYYRPANCGVQIDAAELRSILLSRKVKPQ